MFLTWPPSGHVYLSPHLDDAVLSCGGMIYRQAARGELVTVITIFAASPSDPGMLSDFARQLHHRWQAAYPAGMSFPDPPALRRGEDRRALSMLGPSIQVIHYTLLDCIYRRHVQTGQALYASEEAIRGDPLDGDPAVGELAAAPALPSGAVLYAPLAVGGHVDHRIVRMAVEQWNIPSAQLRFYEDYPYVIEAEALERVIAPETGWKSQTIHLEEPALAAKIRAAGEYTSQLSSFWANREAMAAALRDFDQQRGGERLWRKF